jgi:hypothetical protein
MNINDVYRNLKQLAHSNATEAIFIAFAKTLRNEGWTQAKLYHLFQDVIKKLDNAKAYDAILDTMDLIWDNGWANKTSLFLEQSLKDNKP